MYSFRLVGFSQGFEGVGFGVLEATCLPLVSCGLLEGEKKGAANGCSGPQIP